MNNQNPMLTRRKSQAPAVEGANSLETVMAGYGDDAANGYDFGMKNPGYGMKFDSVLGAAADASPSALTKRLTRNSFKLARDSTDKLPKGKEDIADVFMGQLNDGGSFRGQRNPGFASSLVPGASIKPQLGESDEQPQPFMGYDDESDPFPGVTGGQFAYEPGSFRQLRSSFKRVSRPGSFFTRTNPTTATFTAGPSVNQGNANVGPFPKNPSLLPLGGDGQFAEPRRVSVRRGRNPATPPNAQVSGSTPVQGIVDLKQVRNQYQKGRMDSLIRGDMPNNNFVPTFGGFNGGGFESTFYTQPNNMLPQRQLQQKNDALTNSLQPPPPKPAEQKKQKEQLSLEKNQSKQQKVIQKKAIQQPQQQQHHLQPPPKPNQQEQSAHSESSMLRKRGRKREKWEIYLEAANKKIEEIKAKLKTAKKDKMPVKERQRLRNVVSAQQSRLKKKTELIFLHRVITDKDDRNHDLLDILKNSLKNEPELLRKLTEEINTKILGDDEREDGALEIAGKVGKSTGKGAIKKQKVQPVVVKIKPGAGALETFEEVFMDKMMTKSHVLEKFQHNDEKDEKDYMAENDFEGLD